MERRRRDLTPLESDLRPAYAPPPQEVGLRARMRRRRRERRPPTTLRGAVAQGLLRLALAVGVATGLALLVDHFKGGNAAVGFYIIGAALFAVAFMSSASDMGTPYYYSRGERERRFNMSFSYILAGAIVIGIGVAIEVLSR